MIYIMSDLHGCFDKYLMMLDQIGLKAEDTLYVLGDVVDRGPDGIKILLDMYERENVIFLRGNHDQSAMKVLRCMFDSSAYLWQSKTFVEIEVNGAEYLIAHTVPENEIMLEKGKLTLDDYIFGEPDYELTYFDDKIIVTGHTPTGLIDKSYEGKIYIKNNHIAVDCGAVFEDGRLGCICLDTMKEYYV